MKTSEKKLSVKSLIILTGILPIVVILASSIAIYFTAKNAGEQNTVDYSFLHPSESAITSAPGNTHEASEKAEELLRTAVDSKILKYSGYTDVSIEEIVCDNKSLEGILSFASSSFNSKFSSLYEPVTIKYGEDADGIYDILPGSIPSEFSSEITDGKLEIKLIFNEVFKNMYFTGKDTKSINTFISDNKEVFSTLNKKLIPSVVTYTYLFNADTSRIISLEIFRSYDYTSTVAFQNTIADIGTSSLSMKIGFSEKYDFSYAGIEIEQDIITLGKNGYEALSVTPFTEEDLSEDEYSLRFISSDETVVTVDENGQAEAVSISETPQTVTVELQYLGRTFTDTCTVFVVNETESIKLSDESITLKKGDIYTLSAHVKPDNATVKTVKWVSSDENIIKINESGEITAVNSGTATVTAVTLQGLLAAECTVTVTD
ncbi:MAG: Ig domain-containing protein [Clostridia bacterium]|nr:Ig domain-containing protein [Clostridia bacterium]